MSLSFITFYWFAGGTLFMSHCVCKHYYASVVIEKQQLEFIPNHVAFPLIQD